MLRPARLCIAARGPRAPPRAPGASRLRAQHLRSQAPISRTYTTQARPGRARAQARLLADQPAVRVYRDRGRRCPGARPPWCSSMSRRLPRHRVRSDSLNGQRAIDGAAAAQVERPSHQPADDSGVRRSSGSIDGARRSYGSIDGARRSSGSIDRARCSSESIDGAAASARRSQATVDDKPGSQQSQSLAACPCIVHPLLASCGEWCLCEA